ncbi:hypothetical protein pb186bvf_016400 [Paramecium bursaria]
MFFPKDQETQDEQKLDFQAYQDFIQLMLIPYIAIKFNINFDEISYFFMAKIATHLD